MNDFTISAGKKTFTAKQPTVKNLKDFLKFRREFETVRGFDGETVQMITDILLSVFKGLNEADIDSLPAAYLLETAEKMADWIGGALDGAKKNSNAAENGT